MSDERTCATCWHCGDGSDSGTCRRCRASGEVVSEYREDPEAIAAHLRARVTELERERDAAVEAHAQLLSRIAADGTLDAMERASAAEQRVAELESELDTARKMQRWDADCASAAEQRVRELEGALREADAMYAAIRAFGQLPGVANTDAEIDAEAKAFDVMDDAADKFERSRAALAASEDEVSHG